MILDWLTRGKSAESAAYQPTCRRSGAGPVARRLGGARHRSAGRSRTDALGAGLLTLVGASIAAFWSWRERQRLQDGVEQLIEAFERLGRGDFSQPSVAGLTGHLGRLQRAFERTRLALSETTFGRDYLHSVLNSMSDSVFVAAPDGAIRMVNDAARTMTGYPDEELIGTRVAALLAPPGEVDGDPVAAARAAGETVLRTRAGQTIPVSFVVSSIASADPQFAGDIYLARDITERKRAERRIRYLARFDALTKIPNRMQFQHLLQQAIARAHRGGTSRCAACTWTSTASRTSTTPSGTRPAIARSRSLSERLTRVLCSEGLGGRPARRAMSSRSSSRTSSAGTDPTREQLAATRAPAFSMTAEPRHSSHERAPRCILTLSIGISICPRRCRATSIDLIRNADAAMYHSKQERRQQLHASTSPEMNAAAVERLILQAASCAAFARAR